MDTKFKLTTTEWLQISLPAGEYTIIPLNGFDDYIYADSINPDTLIADAEVPLSGQIRIAFAELNSIYLKAQHTDGEVVFSAQLTHGTIPLTANGTGGTAPLPPGGGVTYQFTQPLSELNGRVSLNTLATHFKIQNRSLSLSDDVAQTLDYARNLQIPSYTFSNPITNTANRIALKHDQTQFKTSLANGLELHDDVTRKLDKIQRLRFEDPFLDANGTITIQLENTTLMVRAGKLDLTDDVKLALQKANATITYNHPLKNTNGNISLQIAPTDLKVDRNNQLALSDQVKAQLNKTLTFTTPLKDTQGNIELQIETATLQVNNDKLDLSDAVKDAIRKATIGSGKPPVSPNTFDNPLLDTNGRVTLKLDTATLEVDNGGNLTFAQAVKNALQNIHAPRTYDAPLTEQAGNVTLNTKADDFKLDNDSLALSDRVTAILTKADNITLPTTKDPLTQVGDELQLTYNPDHLAVNAGALELHADIKDAIDNIPQPITYRFDSPLEEQGGTVTLKYSPTHFTDGNTGLEIHNTLLTKINKIDTLVIPTYNFTGALDKQGDDISLTINPAHFTQAGDTLNLHSDITDALARITTVTAEAPIQRDRDIIKLKSDPAHFDTATGSLKLSQTITSKLASIVNYTATPPITLTQNDIGLQYMQTHFKTATNGLELHDDILASLAKADTAQQPLTFNSPLEKQNDTISLNTDSTLEVQGTELRLSSAIKGKIDSTPNTYAHPLKKVADELTLDIETGYFQIGAGGKLELSDPVVEVMNRSATHEDLVELKKDIFNGKMQIFKQGERINGLEQAFYENNGPYFRIPSVEQTENGTIYVLADCRDTPRDQTRICIVGARSTDGGKTWDKKVVMQRDLTAPNADETRSRVMDPTTLYAGGDKIFILAGKWVRGPENWGTINGDTRRNWTSASTAIITDHNWQTGNFQQDNTFNPNLNAPSGIEGFLGGVDRGLVSSSGVWVMPIQFVQGSDCKATLLTSRDNGVTWRWASFATHSTNSGECSIIETSPDVFELILRDSTGKRRYLIENFGEQALQVLPDPVIPGDQNCQGSFLRFASRSGYPIELITNPQNETGTPFVRDQITLYQFNRDAQPANIEAVRVFKYEKAGKPLDNQGNTFPGPHYGGYSSLCYTNNPEKDGEMLLVAVEDDVGISLYDASDLIPSLELRSRSFIQTGGTAPTPPATSPLVEQRLQKLELASVSLPSGFVAYADMASFGTSGIHLRDGNWAVRANATYGGGVNSNHLSPSTIHPRMVRIDATRSGAKSINAPFTVNQNIQALSIQFMFGMATNPAGTHRDAWQPLVKLSKPAGGKWSGGANFNYSTRQFEILGVSGAQNWSGTFEYDRPYIVTIQYTATGVTAWCDGIKIVDNASYNGADFTSFDSVKAVRTLHLGADNGNKRYFLDLGQVVIFERELSEDEIKYATWLQGERLQSVVSRRCNILETALHSLEQRVAVLEAKVP